VRKWPATLHLSAEPHRLPSACAWSLRHHPCHASASATSHVLAGGYWASALPSMERVWKTSTNIHSGHIPSLLKGTGFAPPLPPSILALLHHNPSLFATEQPSRYRPWARDVHTGSQKRSQRPTHRRQRKKKPRIRVPITVGVAHTLYLARTSCSPGWNDVHLPGGWLLSYWRVPMPPVPRKGRERWQEIARCRALSAA
jgi:hypothetical protein